MARNERLKGAAVRSKGGTKKPAPTSLELSRPAPPPKPKKGGPRATGKRKG